jgi:hypothetical protein
MGEVLKELGSSADYYPSGMADDGFCGLDPRAWIRGSSKVSEFDDRKQRVSHRNHVNLVPDL